MFKQICLGITFICCGTLSKLHAQDSLLFIPNGKLTELKRAIQTPGSHHQQAYASMKDRVGMRDLGKAYPTGGDKYEASFRAREAALLALLAQGPEQKKIC